MWLSALALATVLRYPAEALSQQFLDGMNTQVVSRQVPYQGLMIRFNHQFWRIDARSVCFDYQQQSASRYAQCTGQAKKLFMVLCEQVTQRRFKNMYCNAAAHYRPMVAKVAAYGTDQQALLKRQCGDLRVAALLDKTKVAERNRVCAAYEHNSQ